MVLNSSIFALLSDRVTLSTAMTFGFVDSYAFTLELNPIKININRNPIVYLIAFICKSFQSNFIMIIELGIP